MTHISQFEAVVFSDGANSQHEIVYNNFGFYLKSVCLDRVTGIYITMKRFIDINNPDIESGYEWFVMKKRSQRNRRVKHALRNDPKTGDSQRGDGTHGEKPKP